MQQVTSTRGALYPVKRNINRFPDDFMFQLTKEEWNALRLQIMTLKDWKSQNVTPNLLEDQQEGVLISQIVTSKSNHLQSDESLTSQIATLKNGRGLCAITKLIASPEEILTMLR